ncbi:MAG: type II toxin-antitoxin system RelE/ParE family toxin [Candidatus Omnitrophota bacterium]
MIYWTDIALADMENIREFIARDSEYYALRFIEKMIESVEKLRWFPAMGRKVPEYREKEIREIIFQSNRILYREESNDILILTIIHAGRDLERIEPKPWEIL